MTPSIRSRMGEAPNLTPVESRDVLISPIGLPGTLRIPSDDQVRTPTLLIVGGADHDVTKLNRVAFVRLTAAKSLAIVPGATHLFPEKGALEAVTEHATSWFAHHLDTSRG